MVKLFNLQLKDDDPLALAFEIGAIIHDVYSIGVNMEIPLLLFFKALYPI